MIQALKNYLWHLPKAVFFSAWYGRPAGKLVMIGVTGTKGKTTTAHMIYHILNRIQKVQPLDQKVQPLRPQRLNLNIRIRCGLISTIGAFFSAKGGSAFSGGDEEIDTGLHVTSPEPRELQRLLRMAVDRGITHVVLEVTSNGLDQFRVWGIRFKVAVITNIYPDHLDYHGTMEKYIAAKAKIIRQAETVVMPESFAPVRSLAKFARSPSPFANAQGKPLATLGAASDSPRGEAGGSSLTRKFANFANQVGAKLVALDFGKDISIAELNKEMALAATEVLGIKRIDAINVLKDFKGVKGRLEVVYDKEFKVVIDFAHTPESLAAALSELRATQNRKTPPGGARKREKHSRLIAVFGCAGERDKGRRRMGEIAAKMADFFVITAEDPRSEKVEEISEEIAEYARRAGAREVYETSFANGKFRKLPDRQEAINYAISLAKAGDVVGLFGKGHEKSMAFGKKEIPWSEYEAVKKALNYVRNIRIRREK